MRQSSHKKTWAKWLMAILGVAAIAIITFLIIRHLTTPLKITKIETSNALSSRVSDPEIKDKFNVAEPIMLHFEYEGAKTGFAVAFEVRDQDDNTVKKGSTTELRPNDSDPDDGQRYVSIVNTGSTVLPEGKYVVKLSIDGKEIKTKTLEIVAD